MSEVEQIRTGSDNFTYLVTCKRTKRAAVVDPGMDGHVLANHIEERGLTLDYIIATHHHQDHTGEIPLLKRHFGARVVASEEDGPRVQGGVNHPVKDGDMLHFGDANALFVLTPGHTRGSICVIFDGTYLMTGDTLFIGDCGRCDLPGGSLSDMFDSLQGLKRLPDDLIVYPGHDYGSKPFDTLGDQKRTNKALLAKDLEEFSKL